MTNQEIEKRFLFDLEMRVFKCLHHETHPKIIVFKNTKERDKSRFKLLRILEKIGFKSYYINIPSRNIVLFEIDIEDKSFNVSKGYIYNVFNYNEIPDYINRYKLKSEDFCND